MNGLIRVSPELVDRLWIKILDYLLSGDEHWKDYYTVDDLRKNVERGVQQLWIMVEENKVLGCVLGQIDVFPEQKIFRIFFLGGRGFKRRMFYEITTIEKWARFNGVTLIDFIGRDQWRPLLEKIGYTSPGRVYRKEL